MFYAVVRTGGLEIQEGPEAPDDAIAFFDLEPEEAAALRADLGRGSASLVCRRAAQVWESGVPEDEAEDQAMFRGLSEELTGVLVVVVDEIDIARAERIESDLAGLA